MIGNRGLLNLVGIFGKFSNNIHKNNSYENKTLEYLGFKSYFSLTV
jgi:hypothetical protein